MRYLIIIVCIVLAGVALMPVAMAVGRRLRSYADECTEPVEEPKEIVDETEEELTMEDKNDSDAT